MSGGNTNATISYPGDHWETLWPYGFDNFQLDIVGFLAVLGEGSVLANAQVAALSRLFYLPRLVPAPQALLPSRRPAELPSTPASVTAVHSGNVKGHVHHVANILLYGSPDFLDQILRHRLTISSEHEMPQFTVRCVRVTKRDQPKAPTWIDRNFRGAPAKAPKAKEPEGNLVKTEGTMVKAKATGPLTWVTLLGCFLSAVLFVSSLVFGDGMSMLATILLSLLSTLIGFANKWSLRLAQRVKSSIPPPGDVVIRYPNGSYLVVRCDEDVARELYFAPEEIEYAIKSPAIYRIISLVGTLMLMLGVIALANARLELQFAWAGAYIIINAAHWTAAALPPGAHWDLSCYSVKEEGIEGGPKNKNFTEALWKAIVVTKSIRWVKNGKAAPQTDVWDAWLEEAKTHAKLAQSRLGCAISPLWPCEKDPKNTIWVVPKWDAKAAWNELNDQMNDAENEGATHPMRAA